MRGGVYHHSNHAFVRTPPLLDPWRHGAPSTIRSRLPTNPDKRNRLFAFVWRTRLLSSHSDLKTSMGLWRTFLAVNTFFQTANSSKWKVTATHSTGCRVIIGLQILFFRCSLRLPLSVFRWVFKHVPSISANLHLLHSQDNYSRQEITAVCSGLAKIPILLWPEEHLYSIMLLTYSYLSPLRCFSITTKNRVVPALTWPCLPARAKSALDVWIVVPLRFYVTVTQQTEQRFYRADPSAVANWNKLEPHCN